MKGFNAVVGKRRLPRFIAEIRCRDVPRLDPLSDQTGIGKLQQVIRGERNMSVALSAIHLFSCFCRRHRSRRPPFLRALCSPSFFWPSSTRISSPTHKHEARNHCRSFLLSRCRKCSRQSQRVPSSPCPRCSPSSGESICRPHTLGLRAGRCSRPHSSTWRRCPPTGPNHLGHANRNAAPARADLHCGCRPIVFRRTPPSIRL